jgi:hypothetical protein
MSTLEHRMKFGGLTVGRHTVSIIHAASTVPAILTIGKVGSYPRLAVKRGGVVVVYSVRGDNLRSEGQIGGLGLVADIDSALSEPPAAAFYVG